MAKKGARKRFYPIRFIQSITIIAILGFIIYELAFSLIFNDDRTYKPEYGDLKIEDTYRSVIIRKEFLVGTLSSGPVEYYVKEGEKIQTGSKIMSITHQSGIASPPLGNNLSMDQLEEAAIDSKALTREIDKLETLLVSEINKGNLSMVRELRKAIELKIEKKAKADENDIKKSLGEKSFKELYYGGETSYPGQRIEIIAPASGMMTFMTDGLERILTLQNVYNIDFEKVMQTGTTVVNLSGQQVTAGSGLFKIVDHNYWYVLSLIDKEEMDLFEKNKAVSVTIEDSSVTGTIMDVFENGPNQGAVLIKINEFYKDFYKNRFIDVTIARDHFQGLKIKKSSVVSKDGTEGVYVKDINGKPSFLPIIKLGESGDDLVIKPGYINLIKSDKKVRYKTVDANDVVYLEGSKMR